MASAIKEELLGQSFSGSPGYKIGSPVLVALNSQSTISRYYKDEVPFRGIDS